MEHCPNYLWRQTGLKLGAHSRASLIFGPSRPPIAVPHNEPTAGAHAVLPVLEVVVVGIDQFHRLRSSRMAPPLKKQRVNVSGDDESVLESFETMVATLFDVFDALETSGSPISPSLIERASWGLLKLKTLQRGVLENVKEAQESLTEQQSIRDEQELKIKSLQYQKLRNEASIRSCQDLQIGQVLEIYNDDDDEDDTEDGKLSQPGCTEEQEVLFTKIFGADPRNPEHRAVVVEKMNKEIAVRAALEKELKQKQDQARSMERALRAKRDLLREIPLKLQDLERASLPLQRFCRNALRPSRRNSSQRLNSLNLAKALPAPLYTLYHQLLSCMDRQNDMKDKDAESVTVQVSSDSSTVLLNMTIPIVPDAATSASLRSPKQACVRFIYDVNDDVILAKSSDENDMGGLIDELFPGDTGNFVAADEHETLDRDGFRPYHWCNYLAGLHIPPQEQEFSKLCISTRVILQTLVRRVEAVATLNYLLHSLARRPKTIPTHPSVRDALGADESAVRVTNWTERKQVSDNGSCRSLDVSFTMKRKSHVLSLRASLNPARYPSIPPLWEFTGPAAETSGDRDGSTMVEVVSDDASTLYNDKLAALERRVNDDVQELIGSEEEAYPWVLSHQLAEIAKTWAKILDEAGERSV